MTWCCKKCCVWMVTQLDGDAIEILAVAVFDGDEMMKILDASAVFDENIGW